MADGDQLNFGVPIVGTLETTDGIVHTLAYYTPPDDCVVYLRGRYVGQKLDDAAVCKGGEVIGVVNKVSGTCTLRDSDEPSILANSASADAWSVYFDDNADSNIYLVVDGNSTIDIRWAGEIEVIQVEASY